MLGHDQMRHLKELPVAWPAHYRYAVAVAIFLIALLLRFLMAPVAGAPVCERWTPWRGLADWPDSGGAVPRSELRFVSRHLVPRLAPIQR